MTERPDVKHLLEELVALREACAAAGESNPATGQGHEAEPSIRNLLHYLALRMQDLRHLQMPLAELGLSSLGHIEPHVLANLDAVIVALRHLAGRPPDLSHASTQPIRLLQAQQLLSRRADALYGPPRSASGSRIMVTLPPEAADDPGLLRSLWESGMTCARINTAHDGPEEWARMCVHVKQASDGACRILMDLSGPKVRTGPLAPGPEVARFKPQLDAFGRVTEPAEIVLSSGETRGGAVPVSPEWLETLKAGDVIELTDTRGKKRRLHVQRRDGTRVITTCDRTVFITSGTELKLHNASGRREFGAVTRMPPIEQAIVVRTGDRLTLSLTDEVGRPATAANIAGIVTCTMPEVFHRANVGEPVWIDDGKVGTVISGVSPTTIELTVTHASPNGDSIRGDKGINLPETDLGIRGLMPHDLAILPFVAQHADLVGLSFVRDAADVVNIRKEFEYCNGSHLGLILKIETREAFENLPEMLVAGLQAGGVGVMIARGDLAVEVGYPRLAELQEEVLWLCEAAHVPVVWATQVLETLAKKGQPSRAEVTDAAMGERAECVMLNKGPHIVRTVKFLDDLIRRMREHQVKKRPLLRALNVARQFAAHRERALPE